jgi:hypothetical protein
LKADLKFSEIEASFVDVSDMQEDQILHDAAKVLRGSLHAVYGFFPLQQIICNACRMILRFFLDIVNGQEAQQIIIKLTSCGI